MALNPAIRSTWNSSAMRSLAVRGFATSVASRMAAVKPPNPKTFKIYRWNPDTPTVEPKMQEYKLDLSQTGPMGICGSCAMNIDGRNTLACITHIPKDTPTENMTIYPLPHMFVVKDLVPDMNYFYKQYASIEPWLQRTDAAADANTNKEILQSPEDRKNLD
ncbi:succinate dehydrogenase complex, subunit B [Coemansia sp. Benny D115]|nr:succinate dehydrogenase complex, subunit B [Coemansia sp. Benny D115]